MRERQENARKFQPLEDQLIGSVQQFQSPSYLQQRTGAALADVEGGFAAEKARADAELSSLGVNPNSGAFGDRSLKLSLGRGASRAGAFGLSRDQVSRLAFDTLAGVSGRGDAKVGQAIQAAGTGANDYTNRQRTLIDYQNSQGDMSGIGNLIGTVGSAFMFSSRKMKENVKPVKGALKKVRQMPAREWSYKGDPARHTGPMAEDFQRATGRGNGRVLPLADVMGVQQAAIKELDDKVTKLERKGKKK